MSLLFGVFEFVLGSIVEIAWYGLIVKSCKRLWDYAEREQRKRRRLQKMQIIRALRGGANGCTM
jgi:hypothetical protein